MGDTGEFSDFAWIVVVIMLICYGLSVVVGGTDEGDKVCYAGTVVAIKDDGKIVYHHADGLGADYDSPARYRPGSDVVIVKTLADASDTIFKSEILRPDADAEAISDLCEYVIPEYGGAD